MADKINYGDNWKVAREKINGIIELAESSIPSIWENGNWYLWDTDTWTPATWPKWDKWNKWDKGDKWDKWDKGNTWVTGNWIESITSSKSWKITTVVITETNWNSESFQVSDWEDGEASSGDVKWPNSSVNWNVVIFDWVTGKKIKYVRN